MLEEEYQHAELYSKKERIRKMGLDNKMCTDPAYWCRRHRCWLSKDDAERKHCKEKPTVDLISTYRCPSLVPVEEFPEYKNVYQKGEQ